MRLSDFIVSNMEDILSDWEEFAATLLPTTSGMTPRQLRDHAKQILQAVARDLTTLQSREEEITKSMGQAPKIAHAPDTAAETHAVLRARSGFDIEQLVAEYRALRSSVLRRWIEDTHPEPPHFDDVIRFNEAIDQAIAESIAFFTAQVDNARNLLIGTLAHDMRSPLQVIELAAAQIAAGSGEIAETVSFLTEGSRRLQLLLDDLVDFSRLNLGIGIRVNPTEVDVAALLMEQVRQVRAVYSHRSIDFEVRGETSCRLDGSLLQRLLDNLIINALKYGSCDAPVMVLLDGADSQLRVEVRNSGTPIDPALLSQLFEPLKRGPEHETKPGDDRSLGLGLYIAREIVRAHGGAITARSDHDETVFSVRLPRTTGYSELVGRQS